MGKFKLVAAITALTITGCATGPSVSPEQCAAANWYEVGVQHGKVGANITEINTAITGCQATANPVDIDSYKLGRDIGLKTYCTPLTILDATAQGTGDPYQCSPITQQLQASIDQGVATRAAAARYQQYKQAFDQLQTERQQIVAEGQKWTQNLQSASDTTNPTRTQIQEYLNQLRQQLNAKDQEIASANPTMQAEEQTYQSAVQSYNAYKSSLGGS